jgi:hypothetical protein
VYDTFYTTLVVFPGSVGAASVSSLLPNPFVDYMNEVAENIVEVKSFSSIIAIC